MRTRSCDWRSASLLLLWAACAASCVSIVGQRATLHRDVAADRVDLLIETDGPFVDETVDAAGLGDRIDEFLTRRGFLLALSMSGTVTVDRAGDDADDAQPDEARQLLERLAETVDVRQLGLFESVGGRLGVAQLVTVREATALLSAVDDALDAWLRRIATQRGELRLEAEDGTAYGVVPFLPGTPNTRALWFAAAADPEHRWIGLDGQAFVLRIPFDAAELDRVAPDALAELTAAFGAPFEQPADAPQPAQIEAREDAPIVRWPWRYAITRDGARATIELQLGWSERSWTLRWFAPAMAAKFDALPPDGTNARFRAAIRARVTGDYLAAVLAPPADGVEDPLAAVRAALPVESRVAAWLARARDGDDAHAAVVAALRALRSECHAPDLPPPPDSDAIEAWSAWYRSAVELESR
ncbi:MAG: hypothetical protein IPM29_08165 [Planctomycetes bacterium]|nr:hypothetical protein [Planctomycetota bacterium]